MPIDLQERTDSMLRIRRGHTSPLTRERRAERRVDEAPVPESPLDGYNEIFLECRDLRHAWKLDSGYYRLGGVVTRKLQCVRCESERTDRRTSTGQRLRSTYKRPKGYKVAGGIKAVDVNLAVLSRVTVYENETAMLEALFKG